MKDQSGAYARRRAARELIDGKLVAVNARTHGLMSTRANHGCECDPCMAAARAYNTPYRRQRLADDPDFRQRNAEASRRYRSHTPGDRMKLYVAGPMTGLPEYNLPAFAAATLELDALGYEAVNPGRRGAEPGKAWEDYVRAGLIDLLGCEGVALLDGWRSSRGALLEVHVAEALRMPIHPIGEWITQAGVIAP